jgi:dipeptidyl aminopeptidase/acylaminoacyl peptidase
MKMRSFVIMTIMLLGIRRLLPAESGERTLRSFSVRDGIEMTTFSDPYTRISDTQCQQSPDGRHFFVVTTKGILATDQLQSELWLFDIASVTDYLEGRSGHAPQPQLLARRKMVPRAIQYNSYGAVITKAQWSSDSRSILFLGEQFNVSLRIYRVEIRDGRLHAITPANINVEDFSEAAGTVVFSAKSSPDEPAKKLPGTPINGDATVVTGLRLANIFYPNRSRDIGSPDLPRDLWIKQGARAATRINPATGIEQWHFPASAAIQFRPAISPDGSAFIAAKPVAHLPATWTEYKFASDVYRYDRLSITGDPSGLVWSWPWEYVYVNPARHELFPLVDAPSAMQAGYYDPFQAAWSPDGKRALVTSTFLPLAGNAADSYLPCAVAVFTVANRATSCLGYSRFPKEDSHIESAEFGRSSQEVLIAWGTSGKTEIETYQEVNSIWERSSAALNSTQHKIRVKAFVKQDINVPPKLWATELASGKSKQLWDPNPQLETVALGSASVYRWRDGTGYNWSAGLILPPAYNSARRYPLVIQTHGFFNEHEFLVDGAYTTGFAARALAAAGVIVLQMGDRTDRHIRPASKEASLMGIAFQSAIEQLSSEGLVDPSTVGIIGFSRTSWYVEDALVTMPRLFKAATIIDGVDQSYMSYMLFCAGYPECRTDHENANNGPPFGDHLRSWLGSAPGFQLNRVEAPLRIEAIGPMSILGEWETYSSLFQQAKPVDLSYIPSGQHILQMPLERYASQQANVDWFVFWLKGIAPGSLAFQKQEYARWTAMSMPHATHSSLQTPQR